MFVRWGAQARRYGAALDAELMTVMMQNRDGKLNAECKQRQPDHVRPDSRTLHRILRNVPAPYVV
jgi:hypothetical protein